MVPLSIHRGQFSRCIFKSKTLFHNQLFRNLFLNFHWIAVKCNIFTYIFIEYNMVASVMVITNQFNPVHTLLPDNAIPIKSWFSDPTDSALLNLLPMLDALRFVSDVRSVLSRNLHLHRLWQWPLAPWGGRPPPTQPSSSAATTNKLRAIMIVSHQSGICVCTQTLFWWFSSNLVLQWRRRHGLIVCI